MELVTSDKAPRLYMGRILSPTGQGAERYILRPGRTADLKDQIAKIAPLLEANSLQKKDSPYADEDGALARFCDGVLSGSKRGDLRDAIERAIDTRPFLDVDSERLFPRTHQSPIDLRFDASFIAPDVVPTAGMILSQARRRAYDSTSRSTYLAISQVMESYMLAAAVMRAAGFQAYPATAVTPGEDSEEHKPLIAVLDPKAGQDAIVTFDLLRAHPPVGSIEIISDGALWGMANTMRAQNKVKLLMSELSMVSLSGMDLHPDELDERIKEAARSLYDCHNIWPGSHFVNDALAFLRSEMYATSKSMLRQKIEAGWQAFAAENPELAESPALLEEAVCRQSADEALMAERIALDHLAAFIEGSGKTDINVN